MSLSRRGFLRCSAGGGLLLAGAPALAGLLPRDAAAAGASELAKRAPVAKWWVAAGAPNADCLACHDAAGLDRKKKHQHGAAVRCLLCARRCRLEDGERGLCRARVNTGGELRTLVYGRPITSHVDPIEKKPFYHFLPGSQAYSLATSGCPLRCRFCQNWEISQSAAEDYESRVVPPAEVAADAKGRAPVVAFTYNEPTVFAEYLLDIARAGKPQGLRHVLVSCGYMNEAPLAEMCEVLDAIKIDLKGFAEDFYRSVSSAELQPVLRSIKQIARAKVHLELVNLVVPTLNDSPAMLRDLARWISGELGPDVPVHFTRFHPDYQLQNLPPTPVGTLERAREVALAAGIRHAYVGNVPGHEGNHTYCPKCRAVVIERKGFFFSANRLKDGRCAKCATPIAGVWA